VLVDTVLTAYAGPVTVTGTGYDPSWTDVPQTGPLNVTASGTGPTGSTLDCPSLTGEYFRILVVAKVDVRGRAG
jgi:hypothetical protein